VSKKTGFTSSIDVKGIDADALGFWMILFSAWHFRLNEEKFANYLSRYGLDGDENGEEILSNLVVHALKYNEIKSSAIRWQSKQVESRNGS
jgi:hypothetical protein